MVITGCLLIFMLMRCIGYSVYILETHFVDREQVLKSQSIIREMKDCSQSSQETSFQRMLMRMKIKNHLGRQNFILAQHLKHTKHM